MSASRRIAFGTLARSTGEAAGKLASLVFFIVIARHLGEEQFGDFIFGLSLSTVLLLVAGLGMQEMIGREVSKDARRADDLVWNVAVIKAIGAVVVLCVIAAVVAVQGRSLESAAAILIVSVGISFEYQAATLYSVFDGRERQQYVATTLIVNRISTAAMGIAAAAAGASLVTIAVLFTAGSALGVVTAYWLMHRFVLQPRTRVVPGEWGALIRSSVPLGIMSLLATVVFRTSVVLIGLIAAGSAAVGEYGAAYRLVEATLFVATSFNVAVLPWFSRQDGRGASPIARGFEMTIKMVLTLMLPLGLAFALFAEPLVEALYGTSYTEAAEPLRILAVLTVVFGVNTTILTVLVSRNRPDLFTLPAILGLVPLVVLSLVLIPAEGANGAAIAASTAGACVTVFAVVRTARLLGRVSWVHVIGSPAAAGTVMALCAAVLSGVPWVAAAIASALIYGVTFLVVERVFAPADFAYYALVFRRQS
jgi:O-antigen/teichoic acid export membrane protein